MAARLKVIVLERDHDTNGFNYVLWADVPVARQPFYAKPTGFKSAWKDALPADLTALESGAVAEATGYVAFPSGGSMAQAQAKLEQKHAEFQAQVTNANPWRFYGSTWDGTAWVIANIG
jgi:hypothetical protein